MILPVVHNDQENGPHEFISKYTPLIQSTRMDRNMISGIIFITPNIFLDPIYRLEFKHIEFGAELK